MCGFNAVSNALVWCGCTQEITFQMVESYVRRVRQRSKIDLKATGTTYNQLRGFVRRLPNSFGSVDLSVLNKNLYLGQSRGLKAVSSVLHGQEDGVFLVAGITPFVSVGHVIAVKKNGSSLVSKDEKGEKDLEDEEWMGSVSYIRRFVWST